MKKYYLKNFDDGKIKNQNVSSSFQDDSFLPFKMIL